MVACCGQVYLRMFLPPENTQAIHKCGMSRDNQAATISTPTRTNASELDFVLGLPGTYYVL